MQGTKKDKTKTKPLFPKAEDAVEHVVKEVPDSSGVLLEKEELPEAYVNMFTWYAESGKALWAADHPDNRERC